MIVNLNFIVSGIFEEKPRPISERGLILNLEYRILNFKLRSVVLG